MRPKDADGMANRADRNRSSLIWVCAVCFCLSVQIVRISHTCDTSLIILETPGNEP